MTRIDPKFDTVEEYLSAFQKDGSFAILPKSLVAEHLEKSPAAVGAMIKSGKLTKVEIKGRTFIRVSSLLQRKEEHEKQVQVITKHLTRMAEEGKRHTFYEPLMKLIGMSPTIPADRTKIGKILGDISTRTHADKNKTLLTVLVHRKQQGVTRPGPGFFDLAKNLGMNWSDDDEFVETQTNRVLRTFSKSQQK